MPGVPQVRSLNSGRMRVLRSLAGLFWLLPMLAPAGEPAGFEPVPASMLRGDVLVDSRAGFEIGVAGLNLQWSTAIRNGRVLYHGTDAAARRFYLVDCMPRVAGATMEEMIKGVLDGSKAWASKANAEVQRTSSIPSDVPLPRSTRILSEGRLADGKPFVALRVLTLTDTSLFLFTTYARTEAELHDFDTLVGSFKLLKK